MGFIRGAKEDPRYARKQAKELENLPSSSILSQPVDLQRISLEVLQNWLNWRIQEILGGVEDEILAGMIANVLDEEKSKLSKIKGAIKSNGWNPKELQHTLGAFLSDETAKEFMEELWILLLDAQESVDGIPQAWGPSEREKFCAQDDVEKRKDHVRLGASTRLRSPERVISHFIEAAKEESRGRPRYFDYRPRSRSRSRSRERAARGRSRSHDRYYSRDADRYSRSEYRRPNDDRYYDELRDDRYHERHYQERIPSPERSKTPQRRRRDSSADTYSSESRSKTPVRTKAREASPLRSRSISRESRSPTRSPSRESRRESNTRKRHHKKHNHHKKKHHHHKRRHRSPSPSEHSDRDGVDMVQFEVMLRQKALESIQNKQ